MNLGLADGINVLRMLGHRHILNSLTPGHKTAFLTVLVIATNVVGNVLLSMGMKQLGPIVSVSPLAYVHVLLNPWTILGILILIAWMVLDLALLSRADLTFVLPITASAYVLIAISGHYFFGEPAGWIRWVAIGIISIGAALAGETPSKTTTAPPGDLL